MTKRRVFLELCFVILAVGFTILGCKSAGNSSQANRKAKSMELVSSAFEENGIIPTKYTCNGANISPPLRWEHIPSGTKSLALIVDDPDAPGRTFVHWVVYNLPPTIHQLSEQVPARETLPSVGVQGRNDFGNLGYGGPCPPSGRHRYFFQLYALDQKLNLAAGASKSQVVAAMDGHILDKTELVGVVVSASS